MRNSEHIFCYISGYESNDPPWGEDGQILLYDYCPCCGVEHGYQNASPAGEKTYRDAWIRGGAVWDSVNAKPSHWSFDEQVRHVPMKYRQ